MNEYQEALDYFAEHMILNLTYEYDEDSEEFKEFNKKYLEYCEIILYICATFENLQCCKIE